MPLQHEWFRKSILPVILLLGAAWMVSVLSGALSANGAFGFPLDDPWIHLQFARNLSDYGAFSYYKADQVTSGSTSPLYTMLLAAGFLVTKNEFVLSYILGVVFLLVAVWMFSKMLSREFGGDLLLVIAGAVLFLFEPRMLWIALSGMETTLFIGLLLGACLAYRMKKGLLFGVASGLLIWTRPEAVLFLLCIVADALYHSRIRPTTRRGGKDQRPGNDMRWLRQPLIVIAVFGLCYAGFNFLLSGTILPNTFAAKLKYYSGGGSDFPAEVFNFVSGGHMSVLAVFVLAGIVETILSVLKSRPAPGLIAMLWSAGVFIAYWVNLPHLYQEGRYLMPIIPFLVFLGLRGLWWAGNLGRARLSSPNPLFVTGATVLILCIIFVQFAVTAFGDRSKYREYCKYINDRQVRTAYWIRDHLTETAIVATHDIGAIGFYSGRRIVDMVGLVSPDMIENIGSFDKLRKFLRDKGVTHLACLRNWFSVANQNPVFTTDILQPEIMEVYTFDPRKVHFMPQNVSDMVETARFALEAGQIDQAGSMLSQAIPLDPASARTRYLLSRALVRIGKEDVALVEIENALKLQSDYWDAACLKAEILMAKGMTRDAVALLEGVVREAPDLPEPYRLLAQIFGGAALDPKRGQYYLEEYNKRMSSSRQ